jgi:hypothetical protein
MTTLSILITLSVAAVSITCVGAAAFMAWHQRKGWGWFLFVGFLIAASMPNVTIALFGRDGRADVRRVNGG